MAKRRSRSHRSPNTMMSGIGRIIKGAAFVIPFINQISAKDISANQTAYNALQPLQQIQFVVGAAMSRITGFNPMPIGGLPSTRAVEINLANGFNNWTFTGAAMWAYGKYAPKGAPMKALANKLGGNVTTGGFIGGIFDDPVSASSAASAPANYYATNNSGIGGLSTNNL